MLTWPVGILSVILFMLLFYQFQLYSDAIEQVYYLVVSIIGWILWRRRRDEADKIPSNFSEWKVIFWTAVATLALGVGLGGVMSQIHTFLPVLFPMPAAAPYLDALTTVMSFVAMWLLVIRRAESWAYWIIVDILGVYLYFSKGLAFLGIQYIALLIIATYGFMNWFRQERSQPSHTTPVESV